MRSARFSPGATAPIVREDPLTIATSDMLRVALPDHVLWTHHPNNFMPIDHKNPEQVRRQKKHSARMAKMGLRPGWPDYDFIKPDDGRMHMIEMKTLKGSLSKEQREFRDECQRQGIPWALCRTTAAVWEQLNAWGFPIRKVAF